MKYSNLELEAIRLFGDKTLSFGCYYKYDWRKPIFRVNREWMMASLEKDKITILWHEPHLENLFRVAEEKNWIIRIVYNYLKKEYLLEIDDSFWEDKEYALISYSPSTPLLSQPNLSEIVNLFSK